MEPYVNEKQETQLIMASLLPLFGERKKGITVSYTGSEPKYEEKILNLRYSLVGEWKTIQLLDYFQTEERALEVLCKFLDIAKVQGNYQNYNSFVNWLFSFSTELSVSGQDFEVGVKNLFEKLSSSKPLKKFPGKNIPMLIIQKESDGWYGVYCYVESELSFVNMKWPKETPNFVKQYFELKLNETNEVSDIEQERKNQEFTDAFGPNGGNFP